MLFLKKHSEAILLGLCLIASLILYYKTFLFYFFQDDFNEMILSRATNIGEFVNILWFTPERAGFRPIGMQLFFFLSHLFFNLNPLPYRAVAFLFFAGSFLMIYKLFAELSSKKVAILSGFFWVTSAIHFMSISWLAATWLYIGTFFLLLASYLLIVFLKTKKYYLLSTLCFAISAGSFEFFLSWPIIFTCYLIFIKKIKPQKSLLLLSPYLLITAVYICLRIFFGSLPTIYEYQIRFDAQAIKTFMWYFLWAFNVPEEFKKQVVGNLIIFNSDFLNQFRSLFAKVIISFFLTTVLSFLLPIGASLKNKTLNSKIILLCMLWFATSLIPVLFLPNHTFSMYLVFPSIGLYFLMAHLVYSLENKTVLVAFILVWLFSSLTTVKYYFEGSIIVRTQELAREFSTKVKTTYPSLPKGAIVYYPLKDNVIDGMRKIALFNAQEVRVLYDDPTIRIYFDEDSLNGDLSKGIIDKSSIYRLD